ncbi:MAG: glycosyltransferase [Acidobacteriaceae bacterium]|nr:glycosyltransferase [Acidobacteriaceae bacterium]
MTSRPDVSVCIPTYNHQKYIRECLTSILDQDYKNLEVVITDDCSTDRTVDEIEPFLSRSVHLLRHDRNYGPSVAANNSIRNSGGEFVCYFNSDDAFLPSKVCKQRKVFDEHPEVAAVFSFVDYMDEDGKAIPGPGQSWSKGNQSRESWLRLFFYKGNFLSAPTVMMRRSVLEEVGLFDHRLIQVQDFDLWIRLCLKADIYVIEEPLVRYRIRANAGNLGANTPEKTGTRLWEMSKALRRFCAIKNNEELLKIFPEARPGAENGLPLQMNLGLLALKGQRWTRAFGVDLLYHAIERFEDAGLLERISSGLPDFFRMVADADVFGMVAEAETVVAAQRAEAQRDELLEDKAKAQAELQDARASVRALEEQLKNAQTAWREAATQRDLMLQSTSWRLTWPIRASGAALKSPARVGLRRAIASIWRR